jgi:hypothetical protein
MLLRLRAEGTGKPLVLLVTVDSAARFPSLAACWTRARSNAQRGQVPRQGCPASGTSGALGLTDRGRGLIGKSCLSSNRFGDAMVPAERSNAGRCSSPRLGSSGP